MQTPEEYPPENWAAVVKAINDRRAELGMSIPDLIKRSGVGHFTVRELLANNTKRRRRPSTLVKLAEALQFPTPAHLVLLAQGKPSPTPTDPRLDTLLREATITHKTVRETHSELKQMHQELRAFIRTYPHRRTP